MSRPRPVGFLVALFAVLLIAGCGGGSDSSGPGNFMNELPATEPPSPQTVRVEGQVIKGPVANANLTISDSTGTTLVIVSGGSTDSDGQFKIEVEVPDSTNPPLIVEASGGDALCDLYRPEGRECTAIDGSEVAFGERYSVDEDFVLTAVIDSLDDTDGQIQISPVSDLVVRLARARAGESAMTDSDIAAGRQHLSSLLRVMVGKSIDNPDQVELPNIVDSELADIAPNSFLVLAFNLGILDGVSTDTLTAQLGHLVSTISAESGSISGDNIARHARTMHDGLRSIEQLLLDNELDASAITTAQLYTRQISLMFTHRIEKILLGATSDHPEALEAARTFIVSLEDFLEHGTLHKDADLWTFASIVGAAWAGEIETILGGAHIIAGSLEEDTSRPFENELSRLASSSLPLLAEIQADLARNFSFNPTDSILAFVEEHLGAGLPEDRADKELLLEEGLIALDSFLTLLESTPPGSATTNFQQFGMNPNLSGYIDRTDPDILDAEIMFDRPGAGRLDIEFRAKIIWTHGEKLELILFSDFWSIRGWHATIDYESDDSSVTLTGLRVVHSDYPTLVQGQVTDSEKRVSAFSITSAEAGNITNNFIILDEPSGSNIPYLYTDLTYNGNLEDNAPSFIANGWKKISVSLPSDSTATITDGIATLRVERSQDGEGTTGALSVGDNIVGEINSDNVITLVDGFSIQLPGKFFD